MHAVVPPGTRLGAYEILSLIGEGGMGRVYHARRSDDVFHMDVAIKIVKRGLDSEAMLRRFHRERHILARLEHPSIARVLDGGSTDEGLPYLVMELIDGRTLPEYAAEQQLDLGARLRLFVQICEAVQYAHDRQIVHRDLKPANIVVDTSGRPRLLDFGVATLAAGVDLAVSETTGAGPMTPRYASPEQVRGEAVTPASDQYSLGVVLYEVLTGCPAHRIATDSPAAIIKAICDDDVPMPSEAAEAVARSARPAPVPASDLRGDLDRIVLSALAKDPADRYPSVRALAADLQRYLDARPVVATGRPRTGSVRRLLRRHPALIAASFVVLIGGAAALFVTRSPRSTSGSAPAGKVMLAVLPLENLTGSEERAFFVDGVHEEIISRLGQLQPARLGVIARTSVLQYKGTSKPIALIGRELGASYVLEGSVRESGPTVRVTAQLIQVGDQTHLWAETYDRQLSDLFSVQSAIGARVADSLAVSVLPDALAALERHDQMTPETYAAYLRARYLWHRRAVNFPASAQLAADGFQSVAAAAPMFAAGHASLGEALLYLSRYLHMPHTQPLVRQAKAALAKALTIDPGSATAQATLATIKFRIDWDWIGAEAGYQRALAREPNNAEIHRQLATLLAYGGRHEEAQREIQLALELDPLSPTIHDSAFYIHIAGRRWDKAQEMTARLAQLVPDDSTPIYCASLLAAVQGDCARALGELTKLENRRRELVEAEVAFYRWYVVGRCESREEAARAARNMEREPNQLALTMAELWAGVGDRAKTLEWVEEAARRHEQFIPFIAVDPMLAPYRDDPRFQAVLRQINYPADWSRSHSGAATK
jgi:serine/threonine protein kinase/Tfp pilus assembly protein PilF